MTTNAHAYKHATYPLVLHESHPRCFLLKWNYAKAKTTKQSKHTWRECYGTLYPNGRVTLDYASPGYTSLSELEETLREEGDYAIDWLDEVAS